MREVIRDVGATDVPEIVVINKADAADPLVLQRLMRIEKRSIAVSARTGMNMDQLLALIDNELPRPSVEIEALVPYTHGRLVARAHSEGEVISEEHTPRAPCSRCGCTRNWRPTSRRTFRRPSRSSRPLPQGRRTKARTLSQGRAFAAAG